MAASAVHAEPACVCPACGCSPVALDEACPDCGLTVTIVLARVERWRGYVSSSFVLLSDGEVIAESHSFRHRGSAPPPQSGAAVAAFDDLARRLEELGWAPQPAEPGRAWFERAFAGVAALPAAEQGEPDDLPDVPEPAEEPPSRPVPLPPPAPLPPAAVLASPPRDVPARPPRSRAVTIVSVAGLLVAAALGYALLTGAGTHHVAPRAVERAVRLDVSARRPSWLEIRRGSATGPVLYSGRLEPGHGLHVHAPTAWAWFGAAGDVRVLVDGRRLALTGTVARAFRPPPA